MARAIVVALFVGLGVVVSIAWGLSGLAVYLVLALIPLGGVFVLTRFGDWIQRISRGRFDDEARRRS